MASLSIFSLHCVLFSVGREKLFCWFSRRTKNAKMYRQQILFVCAARKDFIDAFKGVDEEKRFKIHEALWWNKMCRIFKLTRDVKAPEISVRILPGWIDHERIRTCNYKWFDISSKLKPFSPPEILWLAKWGEMMMFTMIYWVVFLHKQFAWREICDH